jgi:hypothetical protein
MTIRQMQGRPHETHRHPIRLPRTRPKGTNLVCVCILTVNKMLAEHNTRITLPMVGPQLPFVQTEKLDERKRGKPLFMFASCCPFCGEKYPRKDDLDTEEVAA